MYPGSGFITTIIYANFGSINSPPAGTFFMVSQAGDLMQTQSNDQMITE